MRRARLRTHRKPTPGRRQQRVLETTPKDKVKEPHIPEREFHADPYYKYKIEVSTKKQLQYFLVHKDIDSSIRWVILEHATPTGRPLTDVGLSALTRHATQASIRAQEVQQHVMSRPHCRGNRRRACPPARTEEFEPKAREHGKAKDSKSPQGLISGRPYKSLRDVMG